MLFKGYTVNPPHRGALPLAQKSQWTITEWEELALFFDAQKNLWKCKKNHLWSIHSEFCIIGKDINSDLYIAKFVVDQGVWHGYPVSPRAFDIPPQNAVRSWFDSKLISKRDATKINQGKF